MLRDRWRPWAWRAAFVVALGFLSAHVVGAMLAQDRHHYSEPKCQAQSSDELDSLGRWIWTDHAQAFWSPWIRSMCRTTDGSVRINIDMPLWQVPGHDPRGAVVCEQVAGYLAQLVGREHYPVSFSGSRRSASGSPSG